MKYIISVHSNKYGDCYGGYDNGQFGSGYPTITTNLIHIAEFDSIELAKGWIKGYWRYLRLDSGNYDLNTLCICEKRFVPVSFYKE